MTAESHQQPNAHRPADSSARAAIEQRRRRREAALIVACGIAVLLFAVWEIRKPNANVGAGGNVFSFLLVNLNIILLLLLVFLVARNVIRLVIERRRRVPGSQLRSRMVLAFVAIAVFPAVVMLLVSVEFMTNTIDSWFNTQVESSLRGAWRLAQTYYRQAADAATVHASALARRITEEGLDRLTRRERLAKVVEDYQRTYGLGTVQVFDREGRELIARFNTDAPTGVKVAPDRELLAQTLAGDTATRVEQLGDGDIIRGAAPVRSRTGGAIVGTVVVDYLVEHSARLWSEEILASFREYRQLKLNKRPFKNLYVLTMGLASLVVLFSATWLGLYLARGITEPLAELVSATKRVAEGDWAVELPERGGDEIGTLIRSFNAMTVDLRKSQEELEQGRRYIENVLANIDAGVVSVGADGRIATLNPAARALLGLGGDDLTGADAAAVFGEVGFPEVASLIQELQAGVIEPPVRRNIARDAEARTLQVTATALAHPSNDSTGFVLFFEDVTQLLDAQRAEAWREVARRIAHEIKNPLTPIQLAAQRLDRRLRPSLHGEDGAVLEDCTTTIVGQVDEMKRLVDELAHFARRPPGGMQEYDLNRLVEETLPLFRQAHPDLRFVVTAEPGLARVMINRDAVKRALINLLDNAVAAVRAVRETSAGEGDGADIVVVTRFEPSARRVVLEVRDSGAGIPAEHRARVFEPYFSTKPDGTGLGLAIVASIAADHHAFLRLRDNQPRGTCFVLEFPAPAEAA